MDVSDVFRMRLKAEMQAQGFNAASLSKKVDMNRRAVQDILDGQSQSPKLSTAHALARALDRTLDQLTGVRSKPSKKNPEGVERHGLKKCGECRKQFTVRIGTIFEESHIPLHNWHCHATVVDVDDVFVGAWRDNDSHRRWPSYTGESTVVFDVDRKSALERSARLYRFDLPAQAEMFG